MSKQANVVLSLDFGTKKIGVCIAETYTGQSSPLPVLKNDEHLFSCDTSWNPGIDHPSRGVIFLRNKTLSLFNLLYFFVLKS